MLLIIPCKDHVTSEDIKPKDPSSYWTIRRIPDLGQETKTKRVWPNFKVFWLSKDNSAGHSNREKRIGRQKKR